MTRGVRKYLVSSAVFAALIAVAGCSHYMFAEREAWRHEAELQCLNAGGVADTPGRVRISAINGPGICGMDYPLKVSELGESAPLGYDDEPLRPPNAIPHAYPPQLAGPPQAPVIQSTPLPPLQANPPRQYRTPGYGAAPYGQPRYGQQPYGTQPQQREVYGAPAAPPPYAPPPQYDPAYGQPQYRTPQYGAPPYQPSAYGQPQAAVPQAGPPISLSPPGVLPDEAELDSDEVAHPYYNGQSPAAAAPAPYPPQLPSPENSEPVPPLGPPAAPVAVGPVAVKPAATLACPIVSALDKWISEAVQPAALKWFRQPVVEIKQISAYSCRGMNGNPNAHISEHAFGNALDIAEFDLADGHKVSVQYGWHGTPEEQGFLHDVQGAACGDFTTVLAPGANIYHYNHIHVDLMRYCEINQ